MIYFDNSATTKILPEVLATYEQVCQQFWGNPSSLHALGQRAYGLLEQSRQQIANLLGVQADEIFFTSGGSGADNWVIKGTALTKYVYGKHIITSSIEHAAVTNSMACLEKLGFDVTYLPVDKTGHIDPADLAAAIRPDTILVSIMGVNNEIGSIQPHLEIAKILKKYPKIHYHIDAVQGVGKGLKKLIMNDRVDFVTVSSHKFHGPRGVGFMYKRRGRKLAPLIDGGGQEKGLRSGTENLPAIAAMAKALRLVLTDEPAKVTQQLKIKQYLYEHLAKYPKVTLFSGLGADFAPHILCFAIEGVRGETIVHAFEAHQIYISTTSACSSKKHVAAGTLRAMKVPENLATSAVRISLDEGNTLAQAKEFMTVFAQVYQRFEKINS